MFHPRVSFASCIKLGSLTCNKETLLLKTHFLSSILSPPNPFVTSGQILLWQMKAAVGTELSFAPSRTDRPGGRGCPSVTPVFGACGRAPHTSRNGTGTSCSAWGSSCPQPSHADPVCLQPSSTPLPLSLNLPCFH